ncbi:hypothetical protein BKA64DRAFT_723327 [Cadophora sp. MPI-SDFR-AT-0126]|nr:hypothetical protein BKA64DRAFT_723327 [Leotiomycetes sp. MPI-SDFR-AT-0126]
MSSEKITCRWAALSLSTIAETFLPDLLLQRAESDPIHHKLVALSTRGSKERASSWLLDQKIPDPEAVQYFNSWEKMLEEGDFDVVYISSPHPLHYEHTLKALACKRNVLVEKPATMNAAQFARLMDLAHENDVVLMEAMWTRYLPAATYFKDELLPIIGPVKRVYADFSFPIVSSDLSSSSRFLDKQAGAGSLLDQGVYALTWADLALNGLDPGASSTKVIHASSMSVPGVSGDVDDINTVILSREDNKSHQQNAVGIVTTSMTLPGSSNPPFYRRLQAKKAAPAVRIEAVKASVSIPFPPIRPEELHVQWYDADHLDQDGMETEQIIKKPVERGWGIWYQADVIAKKVFERKAVQKGHGEVLGAEESLRVLAWMDQARKQAGIVYPPELDEM